jgi:chemotaxis protein MotA
MTSGRDLASLSVLPAGIAVVLLAQVLEGGAASSLVQGPAALIVFGGTLAALLVSFSPAKTRHAVRAAAATFKKSSETDAAVASALVRFAVEAQRKGVLELDRYVDEVPDPFLREGLALVVDGVSLEQLKDVMAVSHSAYEADEDTPARVFEAAAGYAPTFGILGAVLGLIHVLQRASSGGAVGEGIAVAFVATVYGVGSANLLFLPLAGRIRERAAESARRRILIIEGLCALQQRSHPRLVAQRLRTLAPEMPRLETLAARIPA